MTVGFWLLAGVNVGWWARSGWRWWRSGRRSSGTLGRRGGKTPKITEVA